MESLLPDAPPIISHPTLRLSSENRLTSSLRRIAVRGVGEVELLTRERRRP